MTKRKNPIPKSSTTGEDDADDARASSVLPPRPYTEYSIFFRIERAYLLQKSGTVDEGILAPFDPSHHDPVEHPRPARYQSLLLPPYWYSSSGGATLANTKRKHKKKEGLDRKALNKIVSVMWQQVDAEVKDYCKKLARAGLERYNAAVDEALKRLVSGEAAEDAAAPSKRSKICNAENVGAADLQDTGVKEHAEADVPNGIPLLENLAPKSRISKAKHKIFMLQQQEQNGLGPLASSLERPNSSPNRQVSACAVKDEQQKHHVRATTHATTGEIVDLTVEEYGGGGEEQNGLTPSISSSGRLQLPQDLESSAPREIGTSVDPEHEILQLQEQIQNGLGQLKSLSNRLEILQLQQQKQHCLALLTTTSKRLQYLQNSGQRAAMQAGISPPSPSPGPRRSNASQAPIFGMTFGQPPLPRIDPASNSINHGPSASPEFITSLVPNASLSSRGSSDSGGCGPGHGRFLLGGDHIVVRDPSGQTRCQLNRSQPEVGMKARGLRELAKVRKAGENELMHQVPRRS